MSSRSGFREGRLLRIGLGTPGETGVSADSTANSGVTGDSCCPSKLGVVDRRSSRESAGATEWFAGAGAVIDEIVLIGFLPHEVQWRYPDDHVVYCQ
jgi:hypothetical protein